jgi:hypothetical protein
MDHTSMMTKMIMAITKTNFTRNMTEGFSLAFRAAGSLAEARVEDSQEADQADFLVEAQADTQAVRVASRAEEPRQHHHRNLRLKKHRHPLLQLIQVA